jgi:5-(carboxyamino)imidazole ribonucleotide synthase
LRDAVKSIGLPGVLKTSGFGYDGKGQFKLTNEADIPKAIQSMNGQEAILEAFVDFGLEISVVAARGRDVSFVHYGAVENIHRDHILDITIAPARIDAFIAERAIELARGILGKLDVVGVLCVEMFVRRDNELVVNELAPRPHNSGHFSFDACIASQFEQQVRAVCGLPLGSTELLRPAVMVNLLGDRWENGEPNWAAALKYPNVKLHLYGKREARKGRKMGHMTAMANTTEEALKTALAAREALALR